MQSVQANAKKLEYARVGGFVLFSAFLAIGFTEIGLGATFHLDEGFLASGIVFLCSAPALLILAIIAKIKLNRIRDL